MVLLDKLNIRYLQLKISENLKSFLIKELYKKGNYSLGDATFLFDSIYRSYFIFLWELLQQTISGIIQIVVYLVFYYSQT